MYRDLQHRLRFTEVLSHMWLALRPIDLSVRQIGFNPRWRFMLMAGTSVTARSRTMDSSTATPSAHANRFAGQVVGHVEIT